MDPLIESKKFDNNSGNFYQNLNKRYVYSYAFDINFEVILPIIKDFQSISLLIKYTQNHQLSDIIFISGDNSFSKESRFYFKYRNIIDFYLKVENFYENDYFIKIKYNIYKTKPISKNFNIYLSLLKEKENSSKLEIEIILINDSFIHERILNIIYNEFNYNFLYLSKAIKNMKHNSFSYNSEIIKKLLVKYDMTVDEASDGKEAVDMVSNANTPFDLVIMDVHMPVMDGLEATGLIRQLKDDKRSKVPILAVTADAFEEDRKKALEAGMDGHIAKPINIDNLLIEINQAIIE